MDLEGYIEQLVIDLPDQQTAAACLDPDYIEYCRTKASQYHGYEHELERFLLICGYVTTRVVEQAWADDTDPTPMLSREIVLGMESWKGGALINIGENYLKDAYHALVRWWKRICEALQSMTRLTIERECASAIALSADLALARYA